MQWSKRRLILSCFVVILAFMLIMPRQSDATTRYQSSKSQPSGEIVYVREGNIWLRSLDNDSERALTASGDNRYPVWSPDGRYLLYTHTIDYRDAIYLWDAESGETRPLIEDACCATWDPTGQRIAYVASDLSVHTVYFQNGEVDNPVLWFADLLYGKGVTITGPLLWLDAYPAELIVPHEMLLGSGSTGFGVREALIRLPFGGETLYGTTVLDYQLCATSHLAYQSASKLAIDYEQEIDCRYDTRYPKGVMVLEDGQRHELPWLAYPTFSPDGNWLIAEKYSETDILYQAELQGLVQYNLATNEELLLTTLGAQPAWRPGFYTTSLPPTTVLPPTDEKSLADEADVTLTEQPESVGEPLTEQKQIDEKTETDPASSGDIAFEDDTATFHSSPIMFLENMGQFPAAIRYSMWGSDYTYLITDDAFWIVAGTPERANVIERQINVRFAFENKNSAAQLQPFNPLDTEIYFFQGPEAATWHRSIPVWGGVRYANLYPGIDLELFGERGRVQARLVVTADADPNALQVVVNGINGIEVDTNEIRFSVAMQEATAGQRGTVVLALPTWQVVADAENSVLPAFTVRGAGQTLTVPLQAVERISSRTDTLATDCATSEDTGVIYSTLFGSSDYELGDDVAVDQDGNAYIVGSTSVRHIGAAPGIDWGIRDFYKVVAKFNPTGDQLLYLAFLPGGASFQAIAVNEAGEAHLTGYTRSGYPTTPGAYLTKSPEQSAELAYLTKLNATGSDLFFSTLLSTVSSRGIDVALDGADNIYVTGSCNDEFPTTPGTIQRGRSLFVVKLTPTGNPTYSACFGGSSYDEAMAIAVDVAGNVYLTGSTASTDFPVTAGAFDTSFNGGDSDAFLLKLNQNASAILIGSYFGGDAFLGDSGRGIAVDETGAIYIAGDTSGDPFPTTPNAYQRQSNYQDVFAVKFSPDGSRLIYSTLLGQAASNNVRAMALDSSGRLYLTGHSSDELPTTPNAIRPTFGGGGDAFLIQVSPSGDAVPYSTYLGGSKGRSDIPPMAQSKDIAYGLDIDPAGDIYIAGYSYAIDFPTSTGAFSTQNGGRSDMFLTKIRLAAAQSSKTKPTPAAIATPQEQITAPQDRITVLVNNLNIRSSPGTNFAVIGQVNRGDQLTLIGENSEGTWYQICCTTTETGNTAKQGWVVNEPAYVAILQVP